MQGLYPVNIDAFCQGIWEGDAEQMLHNHTYGWLYWYSETVAKNNLWISEYVFGWFIGFTIHFNFRGFLFLLFASIFFSPLSKHGHICQPCDLLACLTVLTHQVKFHVTNCFPSVVTLCFTPGYFRVSSWFKHTHTHTHTPRLFFFNYFIPVTHYCHLLAVVTHLLRRR